MISPSLFLCHRLFACGTGSDRSEPKRLRIGDAADVVLVLIDRFLSTREKAMTEKEGEITSGPEHHRSILSAMVELVELFYIFKSKFTLKAGL